LREVADEVLVHTGQHHDPELSDVFFTELGIPRPDEHLDVSGGTDASQVERMTEALIPVLESHQPEWVLVYGDTNSTLAGARAARECGIKVAHVEAGMRSFDETMPEERNRIATDRLSDLLLCSTPVAVDNLRREGLEARIELVGDVMADVVAMVAPRVAGRTVTLDELGLDAGDYLLVTVHRAGNVDTLEGLEALLGLLESLELPTVLPLHPRTAARLDEHGMRDRLDAIELVRVTQPLGYIDFQTLLVNSRALLTDSGGAQKEAYLHGVRCVTLRDTTEWVETVDSGWNTLTGMAPKAVAAALATDLPEEHPALYGDNRAGERVAGALTLEEA
jgi:UDP-N-acetylglucosamine 2-epimerase (non-hydrolysing)/UDP-GlcNAc3NAcA epimerase